MNRANMESDSDDFHSWSSRSGLPGMGMIHQGVPDYKVLQTQIFTFVVIMKGV